METTNFNFSIERHESMGYDAGGNEISNCEYSLYFIPEIVTPGIRKRFPMILDVETEKEIICLVDRGNLEQCLDAIRNSTFNI